MPAGFGICFSYKTEIMAEKVQHFAESAPLAFRALAESPDVAGDVLAKMAELYPALLSHMAGTQQATRYLEAISREGNGEALESARRHGLLTANNAYYYLKGALTRRPQNRPQVAIVPGASNPSDARSERVIVESYDPAVATADTRDAGFRVVSWLLDHFAFDLDAAGEAITAIPGPSEKFNWFNVKLFLVEPGELPSVETIVLLARRQPLSEAAITKLLGLLGYAASEDFLVSLQRPLRALDLHLENAVFWRRFPLLRRAADIVYSPRYSSNPPFLSGSAIMSEEVATRCERFLAGMCWFIRTYEAKYGLMATEQNFRLASIVDEWLSSASCYVHEFDNTIHGDTQVDFGVVSHRPAVGEFFVAVGRSYEVTAIKKNERDVVIEFSFSGYPRGHFNSVAAGIQAQMWLTRSGQWAYKGVTAEPPDVWCIEWGTFLRQRDLDVSLGGIIGITSFYVT